MTEPHFTPKFFEFLPEFGENNNKPWFEANKKRFEADVRNPMLQFVEDSGCVQARLHRRNDGGLLEGIAVCRVLDDGDWIGVLSQNVKRKR